MANDAPASVPIFIISAPRSGTTWLVKALSAHPQIHATELRAFGEYVDMVRDEGSTKPRLRITLDAYLDALLNPHAWPPLGPSRQSVRDDLLRRIYLTVRQHAMERTGKGTFVDKLTPYLGTSAMAVKSIARLFPEAKILLLVRDGRDVAVSGVMHWMTKDLDKMTDHHRQRRAALVEKSGSLHRFFADPEIEQWATHWRETLDAFNGLDVGFDRLVVRYEDMSRDLSTELARICEFAGAPATQAVVADCVAASTFEAMSGGRRRGEDAPGAHVRKGVVGDWREHFTAADATAFDRIAGETLISWGYEPDRSWMKLPDRLGRRP